MNNVKNEKKSEVANENSSFTKEQLISSKRYAGKKDVLTVLLSDGKTYTISETDKILNDFMKGKVV